MKNHIKNKSTIASKTENIFEVLVSNSLEEEDLILEVFHNNILFIEVKYEDKSKDPTIEIKNNDSEIWKFSFYTIHELIIKLNQLIDDVYSN